MLRTGKNNIGPSVADGNATSLELQPLGRAKAAGNGRALASGEDTATHALAA